MSNTSLLTPGTSATTSPSSPNSRSTSSPRSLHSPDSDYKFSPPPHITISAPDSQDAFDFHQLELDLHDSVSNSAPSPLDSAPSSRPDEKQEVHSGRLYVLRNIGFTPSSNTTKTTTTASSASSYSRTTSTSSSSSSSPPDSPDSTPSRRAVWVRVYRCGTDHFALMTRDACTVDTTYINLRRCRLVPGLTLGQFVLSDSESCHLLEFETPDLNCLSQWLDAFQKDSPPSSPNSRPGTVSPRPRSPMLQPTLSEINEDEEED